MMLDEKRSRAIRQSLETTERELRAMGYRVERVVSHPGSKTSGQILNLETLILVLHGEVRIDSQGETQMLGAGGQLYVPSGVAYSLEVVSESSVYWLQATRPEAEKAKKQA